MKNTYEEVQILTELKLKPCIGIFKDFVQNYKEVSFEKHRKTVFILFRRAFFTALIKACGNSET